MRFQNCAEAVRENKSLGISCTLLCGSDLELEKGRKKKGESRGSGISFSLLEVAGVLPVEKQNKEGGRR